MANRPSGRTLKTPSKAQQSCQSKLHCAVRACSARANSLSRLVTGRRSARAPRARVCMCRVLILGCRRPHPVNHLPRRKMRKSVQGERESGGCSFSRLVVACRCWATCNRRCICRRRGSPRHRLGPHGPHRISRRLKLRRSAPREHRNGVINSWQCRAVTHCRSYRPR